MSRNGRPGLTAVIPAAGTQRAAAAVPSRLADLAELTKPGITLFILITATVGFLLAPGDESPAALLLSALAGIGLVTAGGAALNNWSEREVDARMRRTAGRPLPAGRLPATAALAFGVGLAGLGTAVLWLYVRPLTAALGVISLVSYVFAYTPLKRRTWLCTLVGGVPGALPVLGGWTAAGADLTVAAWCLFGIVFLWQIPHFLSLAWVYREDYRRGGLRVLPVLDPRGRRTGLLAVAFAAALLPVSLLPFAYGLVEAAYLPGALALGCAFFALAAAFGRRPLAGRARRLFIGSLVYLPAVYALLGLTRLSA